MKKLIRAMETCTKKFMITAKFDCKCNKCGDKIYEGDRVMYYPAFKYVECENCGKNGRVRYTGISSRQL